MTTNTDIRELLSLPARELDARLAVLLGWECVREQGDGHVATYWISPDGRKYAPDPKFTFPGSPRSLLDGVEVEIRLKGLCPEYATAIMLALKGSGRMFPSDFTQITAPANIRAAAAVWVLEQAKEGK